MTTFAALFVPDAFRDATSDDAWLAAMLAAERALAPGLPELDVDVGALAAEGRAAGNPVEPLVRRLRAFDPEAHRGATSQDILDTAAMLVAKRACALVDDELVACGDAAAYLADTHRSTRMAARTLLQQAVPTTFGYTAARWLAALLAARRRLGAVRFPAQLGGAAGTLAGFDDLAVVERFAAAVGLDAPLLPWHTDRAPIAALAGALSAAAAVASKIGLDVLLLAQTEVAEVRERDAGPSTAMPHKRNPVRAVLARACARVVHANASLLVSGEYEHARAAGAWHAEWGALSDALAFTGGAVAAARESLESLEVDVERMRANVAPELPGDVGHPNALIDRVLEAWRS